jgi:hypothetical protein
MPYRFRKPALGTVSLATHASNESLDPFGSSTSVETVSGGGVPQKRGAIPRDPL